MFDTPPTVIAKLSRTRGLGRNATDLPSLSRESCADISHLQGTCVGSELECITAAASGRNGSCTFQLYCSVTINKCARLFVVLSVFSVARAQVPAPAVELNNGVKMRMLGLGTTDSSDTLAAGAVYEAIRAGYRLLT
ncbi:hypothetical protein FOZ62_024534 [Perkinsus olseni]|uniref:Uncharacterized protein n=1 Tax=Perkinsus olseni TaxID=32597 RepID=A0A7J6UI11_PEROL|nr:hypothetical protein FOZ62_024534 [Perkinsus olseni]